MPLETASFNLPSALLAAQRGTHRIELCTSYKDGGTTPLLSTFSALTTALLVSGLHTPVVVMIRPRAGDFVYTDAEYEAMRSSIQEFKQAGAKGFVFGILTAGGEVDEVRCEALVKEAGGLGCTFHRAIDEVRDMEAGVESVVACGFSRILTSGGPGGAESGWERVRDLQGRFGERVCFILGGGVRSGNLLTLKKGAGVEWVHSAAITGEGEEVDGEEVRRMVELLGDT